MQTDLNLLVDLFNSNRFEECLKYLNTVRFEEDPNDETLQAFHDIRGRVCYKLGRFGDARAEIAKAQALGGGELVAPLIRAMNENSALIAKTPAPFDTDAWVKDKEILRIGGRIPHVYQVHLPQAKRLFDTNSQTGYSDKLDLLLDAHSLPMLKNEEFDTVCSSHTIEHLVNPLMALQEWHRVLRPGGCIMSVVPNKDKTFDHKRPVTTLQHLIDDHRAGRTDIDWHHVLEVLREHDVDRDGVYKGNRQAHFDHVMQAPQFNVHNHVFDLPLVYVMHEYCGFKTLACFEADIAIYYFGQKK